MDNSSTEKLVGMQNPADAPIGVLPAYTSHDEPVTLTLPEKKLSFNGDFEIKDAGGRIFMKCKAKTFSLHGKKEYSDANGKLIFYMQRRNASTYDYDVISPEDKNKVLFHIKTVWAYKKDLDLTTTFVNAADGKETTLSMRGSFVKRTASITYGGFDGPVVGTIARKFTKLTQVFDKDKMFYDLTVAPGVDIAIAVVLCDCLGEIETANAALLAGN